MPWRDITITEEYQRLPDDLKLRAKREFFYLKALPEFRKEASLRDVSDAELEQAWLQSPDDSGQGYVTSLLSSAGRGFAGVVPGVVGGVGYLTEPLTGSTYLQDKATAIEESINEALPVNPIYEDDFAMKAAGAVGQAGQIVATGFGVGLAAKGLQAAGTIGRGLDVAGRAAQAGKIAQGTVLGTGMLQGARGGGQEAEEYGLEGPAAYGRTVLGGVIEGVTEKFGGLGTETAAARKLLGETLGKKAGSFTQGVVTEALEEGSSQTLGNVSTLGALAATGSDVEGPGVFQGVGEAVALGAVGGAAFGGINLATGALAPQEPQEVEAEAVPETPFPEVSELVGQAAPVVEELTSPEVATAVAEQVAKAAGVSPTVESGIGEVFGPEGPGDLERQVAQAEDEGILADVIAEERQRAMARQDAAVREQQAAEARAQYEAQQPTPAPRLSPEGVKTLGDEELAAEEAGLSNTVNQLSVEATQATPTKTDQDLLNLATQALETVRAEQARRSGTPTTNEVPITTELVVPPTFPTAETVNPTGAQVVQQAAAVATGEQPTPPAAPEAPITPQPPAPAPSGAQFPTAEVDVNQPLNPEDKRIKAPVSEAKGFAVFERPDGSRYKLYDPSQTPPEFQNAEGRYVVFDGLGSSRVGDTPFLLKPLGDLPRPEDAAISDSVYEVFEPASARTLGAMSATELFRLKGIRFVDAPAGQQFPTAETVNPTGAQVVQQAAAVATGEQAPQVSEPLRRMTETPITTETRQETPAPAQEQPPTTTETRQASVIPPERQAEAVREVRVIEGMAQGLPRAKRMREFMDKFNLPVAVGTEAELQPFLQPTTPQTDAVQEPIPAEGVLRQEGPQMGLPEVVQEDTQAAAEEVEVADAEVPVAQAPQEAEKVLPEVKESVAPSIKQGETEGMKPPKSLPKGFEKYASSPTRQGIEKHIKDFYAGSAKTLVESSTPHQYRVVGKDGKALSTAVVETSRGFYFGVPPKPLQPTTPEPSPAATPAEPTQEGIRSQETVFSPDDRLIMRSEFTGEDTEVSYRGPDLTDPLKSVIWTGRSQISVPTNWLRKSGGSVVKTTETEAPKIVLKEPKTKNELADAILGPEPSDPVARVNYRNKKKALLKRTKDQLRDTFETQQRIKRESDQKLMASRQISEKINSRLGEAASKWRSELSKIAEEEGLPWTGMPDNSKAEESARLALQLADRVIRGRPVNLLTPQVTPEPSPAATPAEPTQTPATLGEQPTSRDVGTQEAVDTYDGDAVAVLGQKEAQRNYEAGKKWAQENLLKDAPEEYTQSFFEKADKTISGKRPKGAQYSSSKKTHRDVAFWDGVSSALSEWVRSSSLQKQRNRIQQGKSVMPDDVNRSDRDQLVSELQDAGYVEKGDTGLWKPPAAETEPPAPLKWHDRPAEDVLASLDATARAGDFQALVREVKTLQKENPENFKAVAALVGVLPPLRVDVVAQAIQDPEFDPQPAPTPKKPTAVMPEVPDFLRQEYGDTIDEGVDRDAADEAVRIEADNGTPVAQGDVWIGTLQEFQDEFGTDAEISSLVDEVVAARPEAFFDPKTQTSFVFTDLVAVYESDAARAEETGNSPQVEAVRRLLRHESFAHRGWQALPENLRREYLALGRSIAPAEELDNIAKRYASSRGLGNWRTDDAALEEVFDEWLARKLEKFDKLPTDGPLHQLKEFLKKVVAWLRGTPEIGDPTAKFLRDVAYDMVRASRGKLPQRRAGEVRMSRVRKEQTAYTQALRGDNGNDLITRDTNQDEWATRNPKSAAVLREEVERRAREAGYDPSSLRFQGRSKTGLTVLQNPSGQVWVTSDKTTAEAFANILEEYYPYRNGGRGETVRTMRGQIYNVYPATINPKEISIKQTLWDRESEEKEILKAKSEGHDSLLIKHGVMKEDLVLFNPNQIKSADLATFDDAGNVIPPEQRFKPESNDIRFSRPALGTRLRDLMQPQQTESIEDAYRVAAEGQGTGYVALSDIRDRVPAMSDEAFTRTVQDLVQSGRAFLDPVNEVTEGQVTVPIPNTGQLGGWLYIQPDTGVRFSRPAVTEQDREYMTAVESGDMKTAQRLVDEAAKAAARPFPSSYTGVPDSLMGFSKKGPNKNYYESKYRTEIVVVVGDESDSFVDGMRGINIPHAIERARRNWEGSNVMFAGVGTPGPVTYDDQGNVIPLSQRFQPSSPDIRFSRPAVTEQDREYMTADARFDELTSDLPDTLTQEGIDEWKAENPEKWAELSAMREEALKAAGYNVGWYHGTPRGGFTEFDPSQIGTGLGAYRGGFSFTTNRKAAETYAKSSGEETDVAAWFARKVNAVLGTLDPDSETASGGTVGEMEWDFGVIDTQDVEEIQGMVLDTANEISEGYPEAASQLRDLATATPDMEKPQVMAVALKLGSPRVIKSTQATYGQDLAGVRASASSPVLVDMGSEKVAFVADPNQIKSADPLSPGPKIPPSQWGLSSSDDIRFSRPAITKDQEDKLRAAVSRAEEPTDIKRGEHRRYRPEAAPDRETEFIDGEEAALNNYREVIGVGQTKEAAMDIVDALPPDQWLAVMANAPYRRSMGVSDSLAEAVITEMMQRAMEKELAAKAPTSLLSDLANLLESLGTTSGRSLGIRKHLRDDPRYAGMFVYLAAKDMQDKRLRRVVGGTLNVESATDKVNKAAEDAAATAADEVAEQLRFEQELLEAGLDLVDPETRRIVVELNSDITLKALIERAGADLKASLVAFDVKAKLEELRAMTPEARAKLLEETDARIKKNIEALKKARQTKTRARAATKAPKTPQEQAEALIERLEAAPTTRKTPKPNPVRDAYRELLKNPVSQEEFRATMAGLGVDAAQADKLFEIAAAKRVAAEMAQTKKRREAILDLTPKERVEKAPSKPRTIAGLLQKAKKELLPDVSWAAMMNHRPTTQAEWRKQLFDKVRAEPALADLTDQEARDVAAELDRLWNERRRKAMETELKRNRVSPDDRINDKVVRSVPKLLRYINNGVITDEQFLQGIADKYGIKTLTQDDFEKIKKLADIAQDDKVYTPERNNAIQEMVKILQRDFQSTYADLFSNVWVNAVLSGLRTQFEMAANFLNGMRVSAQLLTIAAVKGKNRKLVGKGAKDYIQTLFQAIQEGLAYVATGNPLILDSHGKMLSAYLSDGNAAAAPFDQFEKAIRDPNRPVWKKTFPLFFAMIQRAMRASDHFNSVSTTEAVKSAALMLNPDLYAKGRLPSKEDIAETRKLAEKMVEEQTGKPATGYFAQRMVGAYQRQILNDIFDKEFPGLLDQARDIGMVASFQNDPTGIGGVIYHGLLGISRRVSSAAQGFEKSTQDRRAAGRKDASQVAREAASNILLFAAVNSRNITGTRFVRFSGNKLNEMLSFIPGLGLTRLFEKTMDENPLQKHLLATNQMVGSLVSVALAIKLVEAAMDAEDDDKEKPWFAIEGSWDNLTPAQKNAKRTDGSQPYTIKVRGKDGTVHTFNYVNWPISNILATAGAMEDTRKYRPEVWKEQGPDGFAVAAMWYGLLAVKDMSALSSFMEMLGASAYTADPVEAGLKSLTKWSSNFAGGYIPRVLKDIDSIFDPTFKRPDNWTHFFAREIPFYRRTIDAPVAYNLLGEKVQIRREPWSRAYQTLNVTKPYQVVGDLMNKGVFITAPNPLNRTVGDGVNRREMTDKEAEDYVVESGRLYREFFTNEGDRLLAMDPERAKKYIQKRTEGLRQQALVKAVSKNR